MQPVSDWKAMVNTRTREMVLRLGCSCPAVSRNVFETPAGITR